MCKFLTWSVGRRYCKGTKSILYPNACSTAAVTVASTKCVWPSLTVIKKLVVELFVEGEIQVLEKVWWFCLWRKFSSFFANWNFYWPHDVENYCLLLCRSWATGDTRVYYTGQSWMVPASVSQWPASLTLLWVQPLWHLKSSSRHNNLESTELLPSKNSSPMLTNIIPRALKDPNSTILCKLNVDAVKQVL